MLQLKQAETALRDGRLDEAYDLLAATDVRRHRRGQDLMGQLTDALLQRGRMHLDQDRPEQAHADGAKARQLGGNQPAIAELQTAAAEAILQRQRNQREKAKNLAEARRHIEDGRLSAGEGMLTEDILIEHKGKELQAEVQAQRALLETIAQEIQDACERGDLIAAMESLAQCSDAQRRQRRLADVQGQLERQVSRIASEELQRGRIDLAGTLLRRMQQLGPSLLELRDLSRMTCQCRRAAQEIRRGKPREALECLRQLRLLLPGAQWIEQAIGLAQQAADALDNLQCGPLGLIDPYGSSVAGARPPANPPIRQSGPDRQTAAESPAEPTSERPAGAGPTAYQLPSRFCLQVDGVGSYLVVQSDQFTLGPISSTEPVDLAVIAEPNLPSVEIERNEGDYFLRARSPIQVNRKPTQEKLLLDGDQIALSGRCQMKFQRRNPASSTAVLCLLSGRFPRPDIRQAILADREILIGCGLKNHICTDQTDEDVALLLQGGRIYCRSRQAAQVNGHNQTRQAPLPLDQPVRIGPLSLVITKLT